MDQSTPHSPGQSGNPKPLRHTRLSVGPALKYGVAAVSIFVALLVTLSLKRTLFPTPLFIGAVVISTWFGGVGPGLFAVGASALLLQYYFISPTRTFGLHEGDLPYMAQFVLPALLSYWVTKKRKDAEIALKDARDHLEQKVQQRTAELRSANRQLQSEMAERRRTEEAYHKIQADLAHVSRVMTMTELTTSIAHEVNQPLAAIVTNGDACLRWLASQPPNLERARTSVARIIKEGSRAGEVIKRIRELSRKATSERTRVDMDEIIHDVAGLVGPELASSRILLTIGVAPGTPPVWGDRVQLQQVLLNLVVNGIEAMSANAYRPRELHIRCAASDAGQVLVTVRDNGSGIGAEELDRIFDAFVTTKPNGIGMGLSISRTIVESHGGKLWAESNPEQGSVFHFTLPGLARDRLER